MQTKEIISNQFIKKEKLKRNYITEHILFGKIKCYFGIGRYARIDPPFTGDTIVIGSVVLDMRYQGKGIYKNFIMDVENFAYINENRVVIESILSDKLLEWTIKNGYKQYTNSNTYYKDF